MEELSIKIKIANRIYPLTVEVNEEEGIRKAAEKINTSIVEYEKLYAVHDKQDLLAMVALQIATDNLVLNNKGIINNTGVEEELIKIDELISKQLNRSFT